MRTSNFGVNALKLPYLLVLKKKNNNPIPPPQTKLKNPPALRVQGNEVPLEGNEVPHGEGRSSSAPGFPSEEGGLGGAHLAPLLPVALESIFDTDP